MHPPAGQPFVIAFEMPPAIMRVFSGLRPILLLAAFMPSAIRLYVIYSL